MHRTFRFGLALLALQLCTAAGAQDMYKCKDAAGKITYSGKECHLLGLIDAGAVTGRATVTPALQFPNRPAPPPEQIYTPSQASQGVAKTQPVEEPERRCFTVKTAKGTATRCNEPPEETPEKK